MSKRNHPFIAGVFVALVAGLLGTVAVKHVGGARARARAESRAVTRERIAEAVEIANRGDLLGAAALFAEIADADPDSTEALYNLAHALDALGRPDDADEIYKRLLEKNPQDWDVVAERAAVSASRNDLKTAFLLLESIPNGKADLGTRITKDSVWAKHKRDPRMEALAEKHGFRLYDPPPRTTRTATGAGAGASGRK